MIDLTSIILSLAVVTAVAACAALLLGMANARLPNDTTPMVDAIEALLPHTQCAQCGYPGCRPYAVAVAQGEALDLCPPGGQSTLIALQNLLGERDLPSTSASAAPYKPRELPEPIALLAIIDESRCIGCALCVPACPVDAILGANKYMHTVMTQHCTGCELCVAPCPVDCISLIEAAPA